MNYLCRNKCYLVAPLGIEPRSWVPETHILSIVLRSQRGCKDKMISWFSNKKCIRPEGDRRRLFLLGFLDIEGIFHQRLSRVSRKAPFTNFQIPKFSN